MFKFFLPRHGKYSKCYCILFNLHAIRFGRIMRCSILFRAHLFNHTNVAEKPFHMHRMQQTAHAIASAFITHQPNYFARIYGVK